MKLSFSFLRDDEANMIEEIANDVLGKLNLTPSRDFKEYVVSKIISQR